MADAYETRVRSLWRLIKLYDMEHLAFELWQSGS